MSASSLLPVVGPALQLIHGLPTDTNCHQRSLSPQQLLSENGNVLKDGNPIHLGHCELQNVSRHPDSVHPHRAREESLWRQYFLDPALWWDNRHDKKSSRSPDFRHTESKEVLWLNSFWKPAWVDEQLAALDRRLGFPLSTSDSTLLNGRWAGSKSAEAVRKFCDKGQLNEAVNHLGVLVEKNSLVSPSLLCSVLRSCVAQKNLVVGRRVHELTVRGGYESNAYLATHILRMYASHGNLQEAKDVFIRMTKPNAFSWSAVIAAHAKLGEPKQAIKLYEEMRSSGVKPDAHVFLAALQACACAVDLVSGRQVHADVLESGVHPTLSVWNCMVDMYAKCGSLEDARKLFDSLVGKDVVTWNTMIAGYAQYERAQEALSLYEQMEVEGVVLANPVTFACLLKACGKAGALQQGKQLHSRILQQGLESDTVVGTCLVDMYVKCGKLDDSRIIFDKLVAKNVVTWTTMIAGYAEHGQAQEALSVYEQMEVESMVQADPVTFACLLKACAREGALQQGKQLHSQILERGLEADAVVGSCLVDMYAKCGRPHDARRVFDSLPRKNVVTWTAMIAGYAEHGLGQEALSLYDTMEQTGSILANSFTFGCLLKACATVGALQQGKRLHSQILEMGLETDTLVGNSLVDMYAKCGRLKDAHRVFDSLPVKDVVTWTIMINGFGQNNEGQKAIQCYEEMMREGVQANETTFTCLLAACSHEGLVKEGQQIFNVMVEDCGIMPTVDHCSCMVDLYGRAGYLEVSEKMLLSYESNDVGFMSLLNACKIHADVERGRRCFESLITSDPQKSAAYVLMGHIYGNAGRWSDVENVERLRKLAGASKKPAVAGIEVARYVHTFVVGEERGDVSSKVQGMNLRLKEQGGHVPHTELVLKQVSEKEKEDELCGHAEKLALAYGLLNTPDRSPLLVTKNLRMCSDCHRSTEIMSRIEKREIVVRDACRVHRFMDGSCQCGGRP